MKHSWTWIAAAITALGIATSVAAGRQVAGAEAEQARRSFETTAVEIASSLRLSIQREEDLVVSAAAFVAGDPEATSADLHDWLEEIRAAERYPELVGMGTVMVVDDVDLASFTQRLRDDTENTLGPNGVMTIIPAGPRPFYCLVQASVTLVGAPAGNPPGLDFCAGDLGQLTLAIRDLGTASYLLNPAIGGGAQLVVQTPMYRGGLQPTTTDERRVLFLGSVGTVIAPEVLFASVLHGNPDAQVALTFGPQDSHALIASGAAEVGDLTARVEFGNGWIATVSAPGLSTGVLDSGRAIQLTAIGIAASMLLGALAWVLATGRLRALRMVAERTGQLRHQALHDVLTGLPNRALILDRAEQLLARSRRTGTACVALYIDIDRFKNVNDTLGHEGGDELLRSVAQRLLGSLRAVDTIGRLGGDEFVVLADGAESPDILAERLLSAMREPFVIDTGSGPFALRITASVGIATGDREAGGDLLRDADLALYQAKLAGRDRAQRFLPEMDAAARRRAGLEIDLRVALERGQFEIYYQPIYDLDDLTVVAAEALLRWNHPQHGVVGPEEFVPILEQTGQIVEVGRWVLDHACAQMAVWRRQGSRLDLSVNISARQLDHQVIVEDVREALVASGLEPATLTIEVTETALMRDPEATARRLHEMKSLGVRVAIDDFGTGYSSLAYLQRFPVDSLKIDRAFTSTANDSPESQALLRTLVRLGKDLGLTTLAEGVETIAQLDHLRGEMVNQAQGFLLARPLPAATFEHTILDAIAAAGCGAVTLADEPPRGGAHRP